MSSMKTIRRVGLSDGIAPERFSCSKALRTYDGRNTSAIVPRCGMPEGPKPLWKIAARPGS